MSLFWLIQIVYWLALSTWFGGVLFITVAAPVIFKTVRQNDPTLPKVLSVNLRRQHSTLLAGSIVGNLLAVMGRIETGCAAAVALGLVGQWFLAERSGGELVAMVLRNGLYIGAAGMLAYDRLMLWPRIWRSRQDYIDHADEPEVANAAREQFDHLHKESVTVLSILLCLLLGMVLFSGQIRPSTAMLFHVFSAQP